MEKDDKEAALYFIQSAEKGLANAQLQVSQCYFDAVGVAESAVEGVKWLRAASEGGSLDAKHRLAICLSQGHGGEKDPVAAFKLWEEAAEQGHAGSELQLGQVRFLGGRFSRHFHLGLLHLGARFWLAVLLTFTVPLLLCSS